METIHLSSFHTSTFLVGHVLADEPVPRPYLQQTKKQLEDFRLLDGDVGMRVEDGRLVPRVQGPDTEEVGQTKTIGFDDALNIDANGQRHNTLDADDARHTRA